MSDFAVNGIKNYTPSKSKPGIKLDNGCFVIDFNQAADAGGSKARRPGGMMPSKDDFSYLYAVLKIFEGSNSDLKTA